MKKILSLLILLSIASQSFADASLPAVRVLQMSTDWGGNSMFFRLEGNNVVDGCNPNDSRVVVPTSIRQYDEIVAMSLAAFASGKKVIFRISGCATGANIMNGIAVAIEE